GKNIYFIKNRVRVRERSDQTLPQSVCLICAVKCKLISHPMRILYAIAAYKTTIKFSNQCLHPMQEYKLYLLTLQIVKICYFCIMSRFIHLLYTHCLLFLLSFSSVIFIFTD